VNGEQQSTFIDIIVKLTLCRVYANNQSSKILTAEKLLGFANKMIEALKDKKSPLIIVGCDSPHFKEKLHKFAQNDHSLLTNDSLLRRLSHQKDR
jgi:hypothetical protein